MAPSVPWPSEIGWCKQLAEGRGAGRTRGNKPTRESKRRDRRRPAARLSLQENDGRAGPLCPSPPTVVRVDDGGGEISVPVEQGSSLSSRYNLGSGVNWFILLDVGLCQAKPICPRELGSRNMWALPRRWMDVRGTTATTRRNIPGDADGGGGRELLGTWHTIDHLRSSSGIFTSQSRYRILARGVRRAREEEGVRVIHPFTPLQKNLEGGGRDGKGEREAVHLQKRKIPPPPPGKRRIKQGAGERI